jgi:hypothetical protein
MKASARTSCVFLTSAKLIAGSRRYKISKEIYSSLTLLIKLGGIPLRMKIPQSFISLARTETFFLDLVDIVSSTTQQWLLLPLWVASFNPPNRNELSKIHHLTSAINKATFTGMPIIPKMPKHSSVLNFII